MTAFELFFNCFIIVIVDHELLTITIWAWLCHYRYQLGLNTIANLPSAVYNLHMMNDWHSVIKFWICRGSTVRPHVTDHVTAHVTVHVTAIGQLTTYIRVHASRCLCVVRRRRMTVVDRHHQASDTCQSNDVCRCVTSRWHQTHWRHAIWHS